MELNEILNWVFGGTSLAAVVGFIIFRKQYKKLKDNEVKVSSADAQKQDIDLSDYYKDKMLKMMDEFSERQKNGNANQEQMMAQMEQLHEQNDSQNKTLTELVQRADKQERAMVDIVEYLNGDYQEHLRKKYRKA